MPRVRNPVSSSELKKFLLDIHQRNTNLSHGGNKTLPYYSLFYPSKSLQFNLLCGRSSQPPLSKVYWEICVAGGNVPVAKRYILDFSSFFSY